jgi:GT2 family glycosyltransferase
MTEPLPASVIVRTIGRPQLRRCVESLAACKPPPAEVLIVDQSGGREVQALEVEYATLSLTVVTSELRNRAAAANLGLHRATQPIVLFTDDDCTVAADWVAVAVAHLSAWPDRLLSGRVMPVGDPRTVPTFKSAMRFEDYTNNPARCDPCACNLACLRNAAVELGGFDERIVPAMEDWDFGYRWVRSRRPMHYRPELVVWHHDWRSPEEIERVWVEYGRGCGRFYAKLLCQGDLMALLFLARDVRYAAYAMMGRLRRGRRWWDRRLGVLRGVIPGLWGGLREELRGGRRASTTLHS